MIGGIFVSGATAVQLFVWNKAFPTDWQGGLAFAIADDAAHARELIAARIGIEPTDEALESYGLRLQPDVVRDLDQPFAEYCTGQG